MTTSATELKPSTQNFFKLLLPAAWEVLRPYWLALLIIPLLGFMAGVVPAWKSELESGLLDQTNRLIDETKNDETKTEKKTLSQVLNMPMQRFEVEGSRPQDPTVRFLHSVLAGHGLDAILLCYLAVWALGYIVTILGIKLGATLSTLVYQRLRSEAFVNALRYGLAATGQRLNLPGQTAWALSRGGEIAWGFIAESLPMIQVAFSLATAFFIMGQKSWKACAICGAAILLRAFLSRIQARHLKSTRGSIEENRNLLAAQSDDLLSRRELIVIHEQTEKYSRKIDALTHAYGNQDKRLSFWQGHYDNLSDITKDLGLVGLLFGLLYLAMDTNENIRAIGDAYFFAALYRRLQEPAANLLSFYDRYRADEAMVQSFLRVLASGQSAPHEKKELRRDSTLPNAIEFKNVSLSFGEKEILRNCSFAVPRGKTTMLLGRSGSGKSTVVRLITGFLQPDSGWILVDGVPTTEWPLDELHRLMSYSAQEENIVDETVEENLIWCCSTPPSKAQLQDALARSGLAGIGLKERAKELSVGQQQRLAFARLLLDESPLLFFDEPFTGLDVFTLGELDQELRNFFLSAKRTILMVSHKLEFVALADHVVILEDDKTIEQGSPADLAANPSSTFYKLYHTVRDELLV